MPGYIIRGELKTNRFSFINFLQKLAGISKKVNRFASG
jgi:hypothetical protein